MLCPRPLRSPSFAPRHPPPRPDAAPISNLNIKNTLDISLAVCNDWAFTALTIPTIPTIPPIPRPSSRKEAVMSSQQIRQTLMQTRPRTVPTDLGFCAVHGEVVVARHRNGLDRMGRQRYSYICYECHLRYNLTGEGSSGAVGFCNVPATHGSSGTPSTPDGGGTPVVLACRRPHGHPPDFHADALGTLFPVRARLRPTRLDLRLVVDIKRRLEVVSS